MRERITAVNRSDCIVINGERNIKIEDQIYNKNKNVKIFYSKYKPVDINRFKDKQIYAFSGIGNPSKFFMTLKELGFEVIEHSFPDHYQFMEEDLTFSYLLPIVMTEKDAARCHKIINKNKSSMMNRVFMKVKKRTTHSLFR